MYCLGPGPGKSDCQLVLNAAVPQHILHPTLIQTMDNFVKYQSGSNLKVVERRCIGGRVGRGRQEVIHRTIWIHEDFFSRRYMFIDGGENWIVCGHAYLTYPGSHWTCDQSNNQRSRGKTDGRY